MRAAPAGEYERAQAAWRAQSGRCFAIDETQLLHRRPDAKVDFAGLCSAMLSICDQVRRRRPGERQPQDANGQRRWGDGFALVDPAGVGLFVRVRESGGEDEPTYTWFHATSVGLDEVVLSADLALLHDTTLEPICAPQVLMVSLQAQLTRAEVDDLHATVARALARVGYHSERHPQIEAVDALLQRACWPAEAGAPMRRLSLQRHVPGSEPAVAVMLAMLARLYGELDAGAALDPEPVAGDGRPGLGTHFVLLRDAAHGLRFITDWVDLPEQYPRGSLGIALVSVGLPELFISSPRLFRRREYDPVTVLQVESCVDLCVTGLVSAERLQQTVDTIAGCWSELGYALTSVVATSCGKFPD